MIFDVFGPYRLKRNSSRLLAANATDRKAFWSMVEESEPGLSEACGCYVFSIKSPRGTKPWYIGKAEKSAFRSECLTAHKINHFNNAIASRRGYPELMFIAQVTPAGRFRKPTRSKRRAIQELETLLIGMGVSRNKNLLNIQGTKMLREMSVGGFFNVPRLARGGSAKVLRDIFGT